jgi:diacylglycerol O-acyltransferase / wax synthase
MNFHIG